jgi:hypothetical protein
MKARLHFLFATIVGLALRLGFVFRFPADAGDSAVYEALARNWLHEHVYGVYASGQLIPTDIRVPGYPAFLAALYALAGDSRAVVMVAQAALDVVTCLLIALLAAALVPQTQRRRVVIAALWLAVTCPFVANYSAAVLTETVATFLTAAALLVFLTCTDGSVGDCFQVVRRRNWFLGAILVGFGALVRPETPLLLVALGLVLVARWWRRRNWAHLLPAAALMALGLILPLLPWAARNWREFHRVLFLAPRHAEMPGEFVPRGFYAWTDTWLVRFRDVYLCVWKLEESPISIDDLPRSAFDSQEERARVTTMLAKYNETTTMTSALDHEFAELASERTARHPLRAHLWVPLRRAATLWFTPRIENLPYSGHVWPIAQKWEEDRADFLVTIFLGLLNFLYVGLALAGLLHALRHRAQYPPNGRWGMALLATFILVRTAFFTQVPTPEPRYMLECFPALLALASLAWWKPHRTTQAD